MSWNKINNRNNMNGTTIKNRHTKVRHIVLVFNLLSL